jgi:hypothetical protein
MVKLKIWFLSLATLFFQGCASSGLTDINYALPETGESVVIFGISDNNYQYTFTNGVINQSGEFKQGFTSGHIYSGNGERGYIAFKSRGNKALMLHVLKQIDTGKRTFIACGGSQTIGFNVPDRSVVYFGDIQLGQNGRNFEILQRERLAKQYLQDNYPNLVSKFTVLDFEKVVTTTPCESALDVIGY